MKNKEKYAEEIMEIALSGYSVAVIMESQRDAAQQIQIANCASEINQAIVTVKK